MDNLKFQFFNNHPPLIPACDLCAKCYKSLSNELTCIKLSCGHFYCRTCDIGLDINTDVPKDYKCRVDSCNERITDCKIVVKFNFSKFFTPENK